MFDEIFKVALYVSINKYLSTLGCVPNENRIATTSSQISLVKIFEEEQLKCFT